MVAWILYVFMLLAGAGAASPWSNPSPVSATANAGITILPDYFGMHLQCVVTPCANNIRYPYPSNLGFTTLRLWDTDSWNTLEPKRGVFEWNDLDSLVRQATAHGVTSFLFVLGAVPAWASTNPKGNCGTSPPGQCYPPDLPALDEFRTAFVRRECGVVKYYEAWNEPNLTSFWGGSNTQLLTIVQHLHSIAKDPANCGCTGGVCSPGGGANPNKLLTPSANTIHSSAARRWLQDWFAVLDKSHPLADIVSFHGYESEPEEIAKDVAWLRSQADAHGLRDAEMWDTEDSWGKQQSFTEDQEAGWLMRSHITHAASGVSRYYWYAFGSCSWGTLYGASCGSEQEQQSGMRKAGIAYRTVSRWLTGATLAHCVRDKDETWSCYLRRTEVYKAVVMWNPGGSRQAKPPDADFVSYRDWQDTRHALGKTIIVSPTPILLENGSGF